MSRSIYILINRDGFMKTIPGKDNPEYVISVAKRQPISISFTSESCLPTENSTERIDFYLHENLSDFRNKSFVYIER